MVSKLCVKWRSRLCESAYCRGEMTYELTNEGLAFCRELARQSEWRG